MAASSVIAALRVNLGLNSASFETGLSRSEKRARSFQSNMMGIAKRIGVAFAAIVSVGATARAADQWSDLSARVGNAVGSMEAAPAVMNRISQMARKSYSDLGQTTEAFLGNSTALKELGFSTERQLDFTEALNNALVINGARGERAASVTKAITDAMATGKMEGDGFNTVLKDGDRIAKALAAELGTTVGGLRQMQKDGKITSDVISRALLGSLEDLRREAGDMPATIGDGITLIRNSFVTLIGAFDRVFMASGGVANAFVAVADAMSSLATFVTTHGSTIAAVFQQVAATAAIVAGVIITRYAAALSVTFANAAAVAVPSAVSLNMAFGATSWAAYLSAAAVTAVSKALVILRGAIITTGVGALVVAAGYLVSKFIDLVRATGSFKQALSDMGALAGAIWTAMIDSAGAIPPALQGVWGVVKADFQRLIASLSDLWAKFLTSVISDFGQINMLEIGGFKWEIDAPWKGALDDALSSANQFSADMTAAADSAGDGFATSMEESASRIKNAFAPVGAIWRSITRTEMFGPERPPDLPETPPGTPPVDPASGGGGAAKKIADVVGKLREQFTALEKTKGMTEAQVTTWQALRDAGVGAASSIGREIIKLTQGIASMTVLNDLAAQLAEARATAGMNDLETSIWQKQLEAGVDAGSANGQIIDQQMRQIQNMKDLKSATNQWRDSIGGALSEFITKGGSFKDVLKSILSGLLDIVANSAFNSMFNSLGSGGGFGKILGSFGIGRNANGTNNWRGGWTSLHERGGEIVNLPKGGQVIPNDISKRMADAVGRSQGGSRVQIVPSKYFDAVVDERAGAISTGMLEDYDSGLGSKVRHHAANPRSRG
ncbi:tape measure protein [Falsirhodobacter halotolerans]|uniref:tape measure protein n=1 Tax=Falsirhodobacter halotolerans TaxID=1146892 RepID=UPI001FD0B73B|nr:tape measure protein [Falsirhodobacter halotolerans]MCJ8139352.1 tape measure protein [Falsirhodobacter halotolerans]